MEQRRERGDLGDRRAAIKLFFVREGAGNCAMNLVLACNLALLSFHLERLRSMVNWCEATTCLKW